MTKKTAGTGTAKTGKAKRAKSAPLPPPPPPPFDADIVQYLRHLQGDRRLAPRTLVMYTEAFQRLMRFLVVAHERPQTCRFASGPPRGDEKTWGGPAFSHERPQGRAAPSPPPEGGEKTWGGPAFSHEGAPLRQVRPHHVRQWVGELHMSGLAPRSIAMILSAWRGLYRWLGRDGWVDANPVDGVRAPRAPKPLPKALSVEQAVALAAHQEDHADSAQQAALHARDHFITELLYGCGLRLGELVGLDCVASTQAAGWVDVPDATAHVLGKGTKRRAVPVGSAALKALAGWLAHRSQLADPLEPALLVSNRGTRLTAGQVRLRLKRQARQAALPTHVHPHMLRHSFASHVLQSSGDLRAVQELLGHAHIATTQIYTKLDFGHLSKVYDAAHPRAKKKPGP